MEKLAKVLGLYVEAPPSAVTINQQVNQLNVNGDNALEAARRLAFALAKVAQLHPVAAPAIEHAPIAERKE